MTPKKQKEALSADDICVADATNKPILHHVSLRLVPGRTLGLIGESGSGKSTFALALMGLVSEELDARGSIKLGTHTAYPNQPKTFAYLRGQRIAYVAQDPHAALNPYLSIGRQLDEVRRTHFFQPRLEAKQASLAMLSRVGLSDAVSVYNAYPHMLSGGMLQRAALAMALLAEPDVLVADEPTTALDVTLQAQMIILLGDMVRAFGMSLLLISHDLAVCAQLTQRIAVMFAGQIVEEAETKALLRTPKHPYSQELLEAARINERGTSALAEAKRLSLEVRVQPSEREEPAAIAADAGPKAPRAAFGCAFAYRCKLATKLCQHIAPPLQVVPHTKAQKDAEPNLVRCFYPLERFGKMVPKNRTKPAETDA